MGGDGSVARVWVGVDRHWDGCSGGRRAGWLLVREWVDEWVDRDSGGRLRRGRERVSQREEVARLFVCQPRWDPLPILSHSSLPRPPHPRPLRALPVQPPPQNAPHRDDVCGCVRVVQYASVCVCALAHVYVCTCGCNALALLCTSHLCITPYKHHLHVLGTTLCAGYVANT